MALANALAALDAGATVLEGSACGLGGGLAMPAGMAPFGNVATEDLAQMLEELGVDTGVDCGELLDGCASRRVPGARRSAVRAAALTSAFVPPRRA